MLGLTSDEHERAAALMDRLRLPLEAFGSRSPYRLSGGEQRRLSLACGLVREPAVLVLDEPTFGQDRLGYEGLLAILDERLDAGAAMLAATHDLRFVRDACYARHRARRGLDRPGRRRAARDGGGVMSLAARLEVADPQLDSLLGRVSPVLKLGIALVWLVGLATTTAIVPPLLLALIALAAGLLLGAVPVPALLRTLAPLGLAALGIGLSNTVFSAANVDPTATELVRIGPLRITVEALLGGLAIMARVTAIASVGAVVTLTTDSTRLADALVQQARVSPRFAYGALAAYQAIPRLSDDLATLRQARRIRGLRGAWHPRLLLGLLILAIRHGDRLALAMDARGFGAGPRSTYRPLRWGWRDAVVGIGAVAVLWVVLGWLPGVVGSVIGGAVGA